MKIIEEQLLKKAQSSKRESRSIEFKEKFDVSSSQDWCEIIKDIVAITNSGGGIILLGLNNHGEPVGTDITNVLNLDNAILTDKIAKYTGIQFSAFDIKEIQRDGVKIAALITSGLSVPLVFTQPGTYDIGGGKQKTAFAKGTIYFRHGAKSEPGTSSDLRDVIEKELRQIKKSWLGNIRKVVEAPKGYKVQMLPLEIVESNSPTATPIRLVDDPNAPIYRKINPNLTHPYRLKEVVQNFNKQISDIKINSYDILVVRRMYKIDEMQNYFFKPLFASPQYSQAFIDWLIENYNKNHNFFTDARKQF